MQRGQNINTKHPQTYNGTQTKSIQEKTTQAEPVSEMLCAHMGLGLYTILEFPSFFFVL
jgi:hypothetical protein